MSDILNKWKEGLARTRKVTFGKIANLLGATEITSDTWDELEANLIQADLGLEVTEAVIAALRKTASRDGLTKTGELQQALRGELINRLDPTPPLEFSGSPTVILVVGVNGSGKTTTIAKLGKQLSTMFGTDLPRGSVSRNGTSRKIFGVQSPNTIRSGPLSSLLNRPFVLTAVA